MPAYRAFARRMRGPNIAVGVEVDLLSNGRLLLADEDRDGWDLLIGAIHAIAGFQKGKTPRADAERLFLRDTERLLAHPIQVLAHPFRFFSWAGLPKPAHLYATVAAWLARAGVAAEINYHINQPELPFIRECLARGVKLALGTDAHDLAEVGELWPHLRALREAGVVDTDLSRVLYSPFAL
jgi:histidinol phosphatase-like PHP family hydrolase